MTLAVQTGVCDFPFLPCGSPNDSGKAGRYGLPEREKLHIIECIGRQVLPPKIQLQQGGLL